ncbi:helix-turn-helix domain-containing protein [Brucella thiophenivorans]|uniref:Helix-turn-helix domain protein n=1 Tax=Brucella thiophenivorans TaxID=571255 RepID=A0A256FK25_9HYPH|nr:AraC family transcriptional regulator [Brucella thiophenivorans]OYR15179.1 helix-turn-helix domain protein [Brucella thiophenivorans]
MSENENKEKQGYRSKSGVIRYEIQGGGYEISRDAFTYTRTRIGASTYVPKHILAIILLNPIRNLRWNTDGHDEILLSCASGTVLIMPASKTTIITWPKESHILKVSISQDEDFGQDALEIASRIGDVAGGILMFSSKQFLNVSELIFDELQEDASAGERYLKLLYSIILYLFAHNAMSARSFSSAQAGLSSYACRQIESYLKENFRSQLTVPEMAAMLNMSAGHFSMCFRESFGLTPYQYLIRLRLDEAENWLMETDMSISKIAALLKFSSQSHLTTALKKYRELTPGEVRRRGKRRDSGGVQH